jgi:hypothetical protein
MWRFKRLMDNQLRECGLRLLESVREQVQPLPDGSKVVQYNEEKALMLFGTHAAELCPLDAIVQMANRGQGIVAMSAVLQHPTTLMVKNLSKACFADSAYLIITSSYGLLLASFALGFCFYPHDPSAEYWRILSVVLALLLIVIDEICNAIGAGMVNYLTDMYVDIILT